MRVLDAFIREHRTEILDAWARGARAIPAARPLGRIELMDHMSGLLVEVGVTAQHLLDGDGTTQSVASAQVHALDRLGSGFDLTAVVAELSLLRACIFDAWQRHCGTLAPEQQRAINTAVDLAIGASVARYADAHDRTLEAIDRISSATFETRDVEALLERLLGEFLRSTPSADSATVLLFEDGQLRVRATAGIARSTAADELANAIAASGKPLGISDPPSDPSIRALYGIPLRLDDKIIGVTHMGSVHAHEFSAEDCHLFASMAARAAIGIHHHLLWQELQESETRAKALASERERALGKLESLLAASPVGIAFLDRDLRYLRINEALAAIQGPSVEEHIGKRFHDVIPEAVPMMEPVLRRILETGEPVLGWELQGAPPTSPGDVRTFLANLFPVRTRAGEITGVGAIVVEVTARKRAEAALAVSQSQLQGIIDHAPAAIYIKDSEGRFELVNGFLTDLYGLPESEIVGKAPHDLLPAAFAGPIETNDKAVLERGELVEAEEQLVVRGSPHVFWSVKFPLPSPDGAQRVCGISTDISDRKHMEDELRRAVSIRDEVLAVVSHDLRNPLNAIRLSSSLLEAAMPDPRTRKHVEMIQRSAGRMEHLIEDLLDTAAIQAGRLSVQLRPEDAAEVVNEALDLQEPLAIEAGIKFHRRCDVRGLALMCDRDRVLQLFGNIVGNAIKFCRAGDAISIECDRRSDDVLFCVKDTGPGIAPAQLASLFQPYEAAHQGRRTSGLGLYISRGICEAHGGRIWAESELGRGARFYFTLPRAPAQQ